MISEQVIQWATANADRLSRLDEIIVPPSDGGAGGPWRVEGSSRVLDTNLDRTIGTDLAGNPTSGLRIVTDERASVITSYPTPRP